MLIDFDGHSFSSRNRTIYDRLSKVGDTETQETFKQRVQEIDPTIRFCNYNLSQKGEDLSGLRAGQEGPAADILLQAKLDVILVPEPYLSASLSLLRIDTPYQANSVTFLVSRKS